MRPQFVIGLSTLLLAILAVQLSLCNLQYTRSSHNGKRNIRRIVPTGSQIPHRTGKRATMQDYADCRKRCERLLKRSLARIGYDPKMISDAYSLSIHHSESMGNSLKDNNTYFDDICWKYFDYADCTKQCAMPIRTGSHIPRPGNRRGKRRQNSERRFHVATKLLLKDCKVSAPKKLLEQFHCVHKFRTFLDVQCSSYAKEAFRLRVMSLAPSTPFPSGRRGSLVQSALSAAFQNQSPTNTSNEEICRFLHYHSMCLANSIYQYCPSAVQSPIDGSYVEAGLEDASASIFNRFTLRDYFLSFILPLPHQEELFSDALLDDCQLYDFQKIAKDIYASTRTHSVNSTDSSPKNIDRVENTRHEYITSTTPKRRSLSDWLLTTHPDVKSTETTVHHRLFSSEEDLADTPPNFHYSSAKYDGNSYNYYFSTTTARNLKNNNLADLSSSLFSNEIDVVTTLEHNSVDLSSRSVPNFYSSTRPTASTDISYTKPSIGITFPDMQPSIIPGNKLPEAIASTYTNRKTVNSDVSRHSSDRPIRMPTSQSKFSEHGSTVEWSSEYVKPSEKSVITNSMETRVQLPFDNNNDYERISKHGHKHQNEKLDEDNTDIRGPNIGKKFEPTHKADSLWSDSSTASYAKNNRGKVEKHQPMWTQITVPQNLSPTPMFVESRVHVKKIIPYEEENDDGYFLDNDEKESNYDENREFNWDEYYAENAENTENSKDTYSEINENAYPNYADYDTSTMSAENNNIDSPYTIVTIHPEDFILYETKGPSTSQPDSGSHGSSGAPTHIERIPEQQLETWLVLLGIYSAFFLVALGSLSCIGLAYVIRRYQMYRRHGDTLKWSWISFDMQERL